MSKPTWDEAPEWAKYLAMDSDGSWWWFGELPYRTANTWMSAGAMVKQKPLPVDKWADTLEPRP